MNHHFRLISASIGSIVHYAYKCHPDLGYCFLALSFATGLAGSIFPFMSWFNQVEHRVRISDILMSWVIAKLTLLL